MVHALTTTLYFDAKGFSGVAPRDFLMHVALRYDQGRRMKADRQSPPRGAVRPNENGGWNAGNDPYGFGRTRQLRTRGNCHVEQHLLHFGVALLHGSAVWAH